MTAQLDLKSNQYRKQADKFLKQIKLLKCLEKYGKVEITGSYKLNLMLSGDIDIHVFNTNFTKEKTLKILVELINKTSLRGYLFFDWVKFRKDIFPKGYYIGLKTVINGEKWKVDIWFLNQRVPNQEKLMKDLQDNLTEKNRELILSTKEFNMKNNLDISSAEIYINILNGKIVKPEDIKKLIKNT